MMTYPPCKLTERYPVLKRIPVEERAAWVAQAERGEALTDEQAALIGLVIPGLILVPKIGGNWSQFQHAFPGHETHLPEVAAMWQQAEVSA